MRSRAIIGVVVSGAGLLLAGCAPAAGAMPAPTPTPSATPVAPYGDGVLTLATLLPRDGDRATAEMAGVDAVSRDAAGAGAAGVEIPSVRVLHRALGTPGGGAIAATVADLSSRGVDVLVIRAEGAALAEVAEAGAAARMLVVEVGLAGAVRADGTGESFAAERPHPAVDASSQELVAVSDPVGDRAAALVGDVGAERVVRLPISGALGAAQRESWGADVAGVTVAGAAASPATLSTVGALVRGGFDAGLVTVQSDIPLPVDAGSPLVGARGIVDALPPTDRELAAIRAEDPAVADPSLGVGAFRLAELTVIGAVHAADDGGLAIGQALPAVLTGDSACTSIAVCSDVLAARGAASYLPVAGARIRYTDAGWGDARSLADTSM